MNTYGQGASHFLLRFLYGGLVQALGFLTSEVYTLQTYKKISESLFKY